MFPLPQVLGSFPFLGIFRKIPIILCTCGPWQKFLPTRSFIPGRFLGMSVPTAQRPSETWESALSSWIYPIPSQPFHPKPGNPPCPASSIPSQSWESTLPWCFYPMPCHPIPNFPAGRGHQSIPLLSCKYKGEKWEKAGFICSAGKMTER